MFFYLAYRYHLMHSKLKTVKNLKMLEKSWFESVNQLYADAF